MISRPKPNEAAAPIDPETLALLLRSRDERVQSIDRSKMLGERARLAVVCFGRCPTRRLGRTMAAQSDERSLWQVAGQLGATIYDEAHDAENVDRGSSSHHGKPVTPARLPASERRLC